MTAPPPKIKKGSVADGAAPATGIDSFSLNRVALVSHDYDVITDARDWDWTRDDFGRVNALCDELGCDAILYAPYTLARRRATRLQDTVFDSAKHLRAIFLEVCDFTSDDPRKPENMVAQAWLRDEERPFSMYQRFGGSQSSEAEKQGFIDDLPSRRFGEVLCILCGETNIVRTNRTDDEIDDVYGINRYLDAEKISVVLNPIHDYMRRWEMKTKRGYLSRNGRTVLSVWNMGKGREPGLPWTVFHDDRDCTDAVEPVELSNSRSKIRDDVRIGIVDLARL
jgi:hypothetical protein